MTRQTSLQEAVELPNGKIRYARTEAGYVQLKLTDYARA